MASEKEFLNYVLDALSVKGINDLSFRPMMGEYLIYKNGIYFGGIFDNAFLVKKTISNEKFNLSEITPYPGAKLMYEVEPESVDICEIIANACADLTKKEIKIKNKSI